MKEIEILYPLNNNLDDALEKLSGLGNKGKSSTLDIYYVDELRDDLKPNEEGKIFKCFRLRNKEDKYFITYKDDHYDGDIWVYSDEYETELNDFNAAIKIVESLGLKELVRVDNTKYIFKNNGYEIVLEDVAGLGLFLEVEAYDLPDEVDVLAEKEKIRNYVVNLGLDIGEELNAGKPELLIKKNM